MPQPPSVLILGIGNLLWADEGFGVRAAEELHRRYVFAENVSLKDGGTQGLYLVQHVQRADILLIFDAIDYGLTPGSLKLVHGAAVPKYMGAKKMSLHQTGFQEVLALAELLGDYPSHVLLVGVQPDQLEDFGGSLSPAVRSTMQPAIEAALDWLRGLGVCPELREVPLSACESLAGAEIELGRYESERPSAVDACRVGDERVVYSRDFSVAYRPHPLGEKSLKVDVDRRGQS